MTPHKQLYLTYEHSTSGILDIIVYRLGKCVYVMRLMGEVGFVVGCVCASALLRAGDCLAGGSGMRLLVSLCVCVYVGILFHGALNRIKHRKVGH